jgi:hypothetical protein
MSRSTAPSAFAGRPRKSPLRIATAASPAFPPRRDGCLSPERLRAMMISEFEQWLGSRTNQEKRPFHEETVVAYAKAARALGAWMTEKKIDGNFTACDTALLNGFLPQLQRDVPVLAGSLAAGKPEPPGTWPTAMPAGYARRATGHVRR